MGREGGGLGSLMKKGVGDDKTPKSKSQKPPKAPEAGGEARKRMGQEAGDGRCRAEEEGARLAADIYQRRDS